MKGIESYDNGAKETWRRWQWNQIVDRLVEQTGMHSMSTRDKKRLCSRKRVLYLCGPDDSDREEALKRGFKNENLVAVDINQENISNVRKAGGIGVCCDLVDALFQWPESFEVDVVVADTCSSFNAIACDLARALYETGATENGAIVSVNLVRGRDSFTNDLRWLFNKVVNKADGYKANLPESKHRGTHWMILYAMIAERSWKQHNKTAPYCTPGFYSYRSSDSKRANTMDSVVFIDNLKSNGLPRECLLKRLRNTKSADRMSYIVNDKKLSKVRQRLAALKAVSTKRSAAIAS